MPGRVVARLFSFVLLGASACGPAAAPPPRTPPPPPAPAAPPSVLATDDEALPIATPTDAPVDASGALVYQSAHRRGITDLAFLPSGEQVVAASADGVVSLVDVPSGQLRASRRIFVRTAHRRVFPERSGRGVYVASGSSFNAQGGLLRWDLHANTWSWLLGPSMTFDPDLVALHPDDRTLAFVTDEGNFALRLPDGRVQSSELSRAGEHTVAFAPSGASWMVFAGESREIWLLDPATAETYHHLGGEDAQRWLPPVYRPQGGALLVASEEGAVLLLHPRTGDVLARWSRRGGGRLVDAGWAAGGERVYVISDDHHVEIFDAHTGAPTRAFDAPALERARLDDPAGGRVWTAHRTSVGSVSLTDGADGPTIDVGSYVGSLAASSDGARLAIASGSELVVVDAASGQKVVEVEGDAGEHSVWGVTWSPDSHHLVTWGRAGVEMWGTDGARSTGCTGVGQVRFGDAGPLYDQRGSICDLRTGTNRPNEGGRFIQMNDRATLAVMALGEGELRAFDLRRGRRGARLRVPERVPCYGAECPQVAVNDQEMIAVVSGGEVAVFDARGRRRARVRAVEGWVAHSVHLSPDGQHLVIGSRQEASDRGFAVALHRVRGGRLIARHELRGSDDQAARIRDVVFGEGRLAVTHGDGAVVYDEAGAVVMSVAVSQPRTAVFSGDALVLDAAEAVVVAEADGTERLRREVPAQHAISASGEQVAFCEVPGGGVPASLVVHDTLTNQTRRYGNCFPTDGLDFSPDLRFLAQRSGPIVHVHTLGASPRTLTVRTYRHYEEGQGMVGVPAASDAGGRFQVDATHLERFRVRAPGPLRQSALAPAEADGMTTDLVADFFAPAPATPAPSPP